MTLEEAVKILNQKRHRGFATWQIDPHTFYKMDRVVTNCKNGGYVGFEFEIKAIAEKYQREDTHDS